MQYAIVAILNSYADAEAAVRDLELAGIVGEQVEVITDIAADARTANTPGEPSTKQQEPHHNWLAACSAPAALSKSAKRATSPATSPTTSATNNFTPTTSNRAEP